MIALSADPPESSFETQARMPARRSKSPGAVTCDRRRLPEMARCDLLTVLGTNFRIARGPTRAAQPHVGTGIPGFFAGAKGIYRQEWCGARGILRVGDHAPVAAVA